MKCLVKLLKVVCNVKHQWSRLREDETEYCIYSKISPLSGRHRPSKIDEISL